MRPVSVRGVGLWTPGAPSWTAWRDGARVPPVARPSCAGVAPTLLRGTSVATCAALEALRAAAADGGAELSTVATIFGSTYGEIQTAVALSAMIRDQGIPSPMRFKNSVHNAPGGVASIAHGNERFTTSLSAGGDLLGLCLLEAFAWLEESGGDAIVVLAEEERPPPLPGHGAHPSIGAALHLRAGEGERMLTRLRADAAGPRATPPSPFADCAVGACLGLLQALDARRSGTVALSVADGAPWLVDVVAST
ncbi:MAG: beta-ketoacyl synthase chain length factor [Polyangiales bacterium]